MTPALLISITGVLAIVCIYFWWVRKPQQHSRHDKFPIGSHDARR